MPGRVVLVEVFRSFEHEPRHHKKCKVCERRRMTTRQRWRIDGIEIEVFVCNECLTATPPWNGKYQRVS